MKPANNERTTPETPQPDSVARTEDSDNARLPAVRKRLCLLFPTDSDFEAFCLDYFPEVHARFSAGMDRVHKHNLLLSIAPLEQLVHALATWSHPLRGMGSGFSIRAPRELKLAAALVAAGTAGALWWSVQDGGPRPHRPARPESAILAAPAPTPSPAGGIVTAGPGAATPVGGAACRANGAGKKSDKSPTVNPHPRVRRSAQKPPAPDREPKEFTDGDVEIIGK